MSRVALVQTQVLMEMPVPNMAKRLIFSTSRLGRFLISHSGMGLLVCVAMVTLASHLQGQTWGTAVAVRTGTPPHNDAQHPKKEVMRGAASTPTPSHAQDVFPKAALPLRLVEEVVEVAAEGDEDEAEGQEAEDAWKRSWKSPIQPNLKGTRTKTPRHHQRSFVPPLGDQNWAV